MIHKDLIQKRDLMDTKYKEMKKNHEDSLNYKRKSQNSLGLKTKKDRENGLLFIQKEMKVDSNYYKSLVEKQKQIFLKQEELHSFLTKEINLQTESSNLDKKVFVKMINLSWKGSQNLFKLQQKQYLRFQKKQEKELKSIELIYLQKVSLSLIEELNKLSKEIVSKRGRERELTRNKIKETDLELSKYQVMFNEKLKAEGKNLSFKQTFKFKGFSKSLDFIRMSISKAIEQDNL